MTADKIIKIVLGDVTTDNFKLTLHRRLERELKRISRLSTTPGRISDKVEITGKSGQKYNFVMVDFYINGIISSCYKLFMYFIVHSRYDIMYYTVSFDDERGFNTTSPESIHINRFTSHVVHRYIERHGGAQYGEKGFITMSTANSFFDPVDDEQGNIVAVTNHGTFVGKRINGKQCYFTFYSDTIANDNHAMRKCISDTTIRDEAEHYKIKCNVESLINLFKHNIISANELISSIEKELQHADSNFYTYVGLSEQSYRRDIGRVITEERTLRRNETHRNAHIERRQSKPHLATGIQRTPLSVQNAETNIFRHFKGIHIQDSKSEVLQS